MSFVSNKKKGNSSWVKLGSVLKNQEGDGFWVSITASPKSKYKNTTRVFIVDEKTGKGGEVHSLSMFKPDKGSKKAEYVKFDLCVNLDNEKQFTYDKGVSIDEDEAESKSGGYTKATTATDDDF